MPVAMGRETEEAMPARALEASVWESLPGIQVGCEQGPPGTEPLPERVRLSGCDFQPPDRTCESCFGRGNSFDVLYTLTGRWRPNPPEGGAARAPCPIRVE